MKIIPSYVSATQKVLPQKSMIKQPMFTSSEPSFKSNLQIIKNGLYKQHDFEANKILKKIRQDRVVADFMDKYAKKMSLFAKKSRKGVLNSVRIEYDKPNEKPLEKFLNKFTKSDNVIEIHGDGQGIYDATDNLCEKCGEQGNLRSCVLVALANMYALKPEEETKEKGYQKII